MDTDKVLSRLYTIALIAVLVALLVRLLGLGWPMLWR